MGAKKRHHFIPRMLLNRFSSRKNNERDIFHILRYEKSGHPIEISTKDASVGRYFHGKEIAGLEDHFSEKEGSYSSVLRSIDISKDVKDLNGEVSDIFWALNLRTRSMRVRLSNTINDMLQTLAEESYSESAQAYYIRNFEEFLSKKVEEELRHINVFQRIEYKKSDEHKKHVREIRERFKHLLNSGGISAPMDVGFRMMKNIVEEHDLIKGAHNDAMLQWIRDGGKCPENRKPKRYFLIENELNSFILGDTCSFSLGSDGRVSLIMFLGTSVEEIYLPISPSSVLCGVFHDGFPSLNVESIRTSAAAVSWECFYASCPNDDLAKLSVMIGRSSRIVSDQDFREVIHKIWKPTP